MIFYLNIVFIYSLSKHFAVLNPHGTDILFNYGMYEYLLDTRQNIPASRVLGVQKLPREEGSNLIFRVFFFTGMQLKVMQSQVFSGRGCLNLFLERAKTFHPYRISLN